MEKVSICHACGRTIESEFLFCPWCGSSMEIDEPLSARFDEVFSEVAAIQTTMTGSRITRIEHELGELEKDLSHFLSGIPH